MYYRNAWGLARHKLLRFLEKPHYPLVLGILARFDRKSHGDMKVAVFEYLQYLSTDFSTCYWVYNLPKIGRPGSKNHSSTLDDLYEVRRRVMKSTRDR